MQITLIRHGATAGNLEHRYVGTTDEELTEDSIRELKENYDRYPQPDCVFASPMRRCIQTAELLFPGCQVQILPDLRECAFGEFEYKNYQELQGDARYQAWIDSGGTLPFPGGESRDTFAARCQEAFLAGCQMARKRGCTSPAFVVHGGTIMAILDRFSSPHQDYFDWQAGNLEGYTGQMPEDTNPVICELTHLPLPAAVGIEDQFVLRKNKKLQCGYTTGSCAAAASKAAAEMLLTGNICSRVHLMTPRGIMLHLTTEEAQISGQRAGCGVRKFAGDDPDATDGLLICAWAEKTVEPGIWIDGGAGVGRVTKPGLEQPVGNAAINRVPREMITREVQSVCEAYGYTGGMRITVSVPGGEEVAKKTFNPHIGIHGGISILGTSGIVMPMSEEALVASIRVEMKQKAANGESYLLITPGNYGADFIRRKERSDLLDAKHSMKCSNYVGETLDMAVELGVRGILFVAHIGKFIKVSGGIMNTHSAHADCRAELMAAQAMRAGAPADTVRRLLASNTTEEAVGILRQDGMLEATIREILERIHFHLQKHCQGAIETEVILFSNQHGYLGETAGADEMMEKIIRQGGMQDEKYV
jgi:cobalt-precorrin-5B (C1)-methyltransferase